MRNSYKIVGGNPEERTSLGELHFFIRLFCNCVSSAGVM